MHIYIQEIEEEWYGNQDSGEYEYEDQDQDQ